MLSTLLQIGPLKVHAYGLLIAIGFLTALHFIQRDAKRAGMDPQLLANLTFVALLLGIAGTRLLHILMFPSAYSWKRPLEWIAIWQGGLVFQGAIPPVIIFGWWATRKYKLGFWRTADIVAPYIPLAHAFGRLGCFMNGCCYGKRTDLPWGICFPRVPWDANELPAGSPPFIDHWQRYPELADAHWSYPVHPTQLYSAIGLLAFCGLLLYLRERRRPFEGFGLPLYGILYGVGRFLVEFLRGDHNPSIFSPLSDQQIFSLVTVAIAAFVYAILWSQDRKKRRSY